MNEAYCRDWTYWCSHWELLSRCYAVNVKAGPKTEEIGPDMVSQVNYAGFESFILVLQRPTKCGFSPVSAVNGGSA